MLEPHIKYTSLIYGLIFLAMSLFLAGKTRKAISPSSRNIFWAFTAFSIMKAMSIFLGFSIEFFPSNDMLLENDMSPVVIARALAVISSEISNLFLFHFGISILTYKASLRINYKIFPALLFSVYAILNLSGIIEPLISDKISRQSFGFTGAFLASFGCFNLYKLKRASEGGKLLSGPITSGIALLFYSFTEGIIENPILGVQVELLRLLSAIVLLTVSFFVVNLLKEKENRIGFI